MRWPKFSFRARLAIAFVLLSAGTAAVVLHLAWRKARAAQLEDLRTLMTSECAAVAPEFDGDEHAAMAWSPAIVADPRFLAMKAIGDRVLASNKRFREVYTISVVGDLGPGQGRQALDRNVEDIGHTYEMSRFPAMMRALTEPAADEDVSVDEYGPSLSGYAPIRDKAGKVVGIFGIDVDGSTVDAMQSQLLALLAGGAAVAVIASALLAWFFASRITRPVSVLAAGIDRVAGGDFETRVDTALPDEFGRLAGEFNDMVGKLGEHQRLRQALQVAMEVQQRLLPSAPPAVAGLEVSGSSVYCDETGGDYFDYPRILLLAKGRVGLTIGDVTGHGIGAALLMASGRAVLRSRAEADTPPGELLGLVNRHLSQDATQGKFMTLFYGVIDPGASDPWALNPAGGTLVYANAGQGGCYVYRRAEDRFEELTASGPPLGVIAEVAFEERRVEGLREGDLVLLGTDGIWEAQDVDGAFFDFERYLAVVRANATKPSQVIEKAVMAAVTAFRRGAPQTDDITLVVAKMTRSTGGATATS